jgi:hypothetical protein
VSAPLLFSILYRSDMSETYSTADPGFNVHLESSPLLTIAKAAISNGIFALRSAEIS